MIWIYPTCVESKNIESKKRGKPKCQMKKISQKNSLAYPHPHSLYTLSELLYPIFTHLVMLPIFWQLPFDIFSFRRELDKNSVQCVRIFHLWKQMQYLTICNKIRFDKKKFSIKRVKIFHAWKQMQHLTMYNTGTLVKTKNIQ